MEDQDQLIFDKLLEKHNEQIKKYEDLSNKYQSLEKSWSDLLRRSTEKDVIIKNQQITIADLRNSFIKYTRDRIMKDKWQIIILVAMVFFNLICGIRYFKKTYQLNKAQSITTHANKQKPTDSIDTSHMP